MALWCAALPLVLASRSRSRRAMLEAAGIPVEISLPQIDERVVEAAAGPLSPGEAAALLAAAKAKAVAKNFPGRLVVGADQTLALGTRRFNKPVDRPTALAQLNDLSGNIHELHSAVAVARGQDILFTAIETARLRMRSFSAGFVERYLDAAGDAVLDSVGAYQLEALGVHLFERVEGDHFTILGMPLLRLLDFLRQEGSVIR